MNRKTMLTMLVLAVAVVAVPGEAAAATSTPYAVPVNLTLPFIVMGDDAFLSEIVGSAFIAAKVPLGDGLLRVDVHCSSEIACLGLVVGQ